MTGKKRRWCGKDGNDAVRSGGEVQRGSRNRRAEAACRTGAACGCRRMMLVRGDVVVVPGVVMMGADILRMMAVTIRGDGGIRVRMRKHQRRSGSLVHIVDMIAGRTPGCCHALNRQGQHEQPDEQGTDEGMHWFQFNTCLENLRTSKSKWRLQEGLALPRRRGLIRIAGANSPGDIRNQATYAI